MPVPKKRTSRAKRDMRRSHDALVGVLYSTCPECQSPTKSHHACPQCGYYRGRAAFPSKSEATKSK